MIVHQYPLARNKVAHRNLASRAPGWRRFWHGPFLTQNRRVPAADDLIELWDYTADDISRERMPSQKMPTPTRPILICTIASRDLIVSFQGLSRRSSSTRRRPRLAAASAPRKWMEILRENCFKTRCNDSEQRTA